jgi:hypothetical protein
MSVIAAIVRYLNKSAPLGKSCGLAENEKDADYKGSRRLCSDFHLNLLVARFAADAEAAPIT